MVRLSSLLQVSVVWSCDFDNEEVRFCTLREREEVGGYQPERAVLADTQTKDKRYDPKSDSRLLMQR